MAVTYIKWTLNRTNELVLYQNRENVADWLVLAPRNLVRSDFAYLRNTGIPWCDNQGRFNDGHWLELATWDAQGVQRTRYAIWQHDRGRDRGRDGDRVRFSTGAWADVNGNHVPGGETVDGERGFEIKWDANNPGNLRPLHPRPPRLEGFPTLVAEDESPKPDAELSPASERNINSVVPPGSAYLPLRSDKVVPATGRGEAVLGHYARPDLPNNGDRWHYHVYPDGPGLYPGLSQDQLRVGLRKRTWGQPKVIAVYTRKPDGTFQYKESTTLQKDAYKDPIRLHSLTRGETLGLMKSQGDGGGDRFIAYDPTELFRLFGGKVVIINWWDH